MYMLRNIVDYFNYKKYNYNGNIAILCLVLTTSIFRNLLSFKYWYFTYPFYVFAYIGNRFFIIIMGLVFAGLSYLTITSDYANLYVKKLQLIELVICLIFIYRDLIFRFISMTQHKKIKKEISKKLVMKIFLIILAWFTFWYSVAQYIALQPIS